MGGRVSTDRGFAILNATNVTVTCGCSIAGATQKYENYVQPGKIFYRWPGFALFMTVFAVISTPKTVYDDEKAKKETWHLIQVLVSWIIRIAKMIGLSFIPVWLNVILMFFGNMFGLKETEVDANLRNSGEESGWIKGNTVDITDFPKPFPPEQEKSFRSALEKSNLYEGRNGYAGGDGAWFILEGGPSFDPETKEWKPEDFRLKESSREEIWQMGEFTKYSCDCYYTKPREQMPDVVRQPPKDKSK